MSNPVVILDTARRLGPERAASRGIVPRPVRTRHGYMVDASMMGAELPVPADSRWQRWAANPDHPHNPSGCVEIWFSRVYLVQIARAPSEPWQRLSIRRIDGREVTERWDELQAIKNEVADPEAMAIEIFPAESTLVNLAPMRHLFIVPAGFEIPCLWKRDDTTTTFGDSACSVA